MNATTTYVTRSKQGRLTAHTADSLRDEMQRHGLRYSELMDHMADVDAGYRLTADDGTEFYAASWPEVP